MNTLLKLLGYVALSAVSIFYTLFILTKIYAITLAPVGAPTLTWTQMYGITLFLSAATYNPEIHKERVSGEDRTQKALVNVFTHAIAITVLWGLSYWICG